MNEYVVVAYGGHVIDPDVRSPGWLILWAGASQPNATHWGVHFARFHECVTYVYHVVEERSGGYRSDRVPEWVPVAKCFSDGTFHIVERNEE